MNVIIDTGVTVAGIYWTKEPHRCLLAWAHRSFTFVVSLNILDEYERVAWEIKEQERFEKSPAPALDWIKRKAHRVEPVSLPMQICRDRSDEKFLECALACKADYVVSRDSDLLELRKPFGIEIVTPRRFLSILSKQQD